MSHVKAGGSTKNLRDSNPKYLGVKLFDGEKAQKGSVIIRQRGTRYLPGENVRLGRDHTIYSDMVGTVKYSEKRKRGFNGQAKKFKVVSVK